MSRSSVVSNDELHVRIDAYGLVRELSFPHVGYGQYIPGLAHKIGVRVNGMTSWVDDGTWRSKTRHDHRALVTTVVLVNEAIGVLLELESFVSSEANILIRNIHVVNLSHKQRSVSIFLHQAFLIEAPSLPDTAQFLPHDDAVLHYAGRRAFVATGVTDIGQPCDQHSIGLFGNGRDGTWRDAEDGELSGYDAEQGQVDSTLRFSLTIGALSSRRLYYWLSAGTSPRVAVKLKRSIALPDIMRHHERTVAWWRTWLGAGFKMAERISPKYRQVFIDSMVSERAHIDRSGAIMTTGSGAQLYCSPHDAAYALWPLARLGYTDESLRFFSFCRAALTEQGCLQLHYRADGAIGGTRLPYNGALPPIHSSDTAIALFVFAQFYALNRQPTWLKNFYTSLIEPMATFLADFTQENRLPKPSHVIDTSTVTVNTYDAAVACAALTAAADLAEAAGDQHNTVAWRTAAEEMHQAILRHFCDTEGVVYDDETMSSVSIRSFFGVFMFGILPPGDAVLVRTVARIEQELRLETGLFRESDNQSIDYVGSLWMAQYYLEVGRGNEADAIIQQVIAATESADDTIMTMRLHAEIISSLLDTIDRA